MRRDYSWDIKTGTDLRLSQYRLSDNYLRFYLKYIRKNLDKIKRRQFDFISFLNLPQWPIVMGLQFENLVVNNRKRLHEVLGIQSQEIVNANPYFQTKTTRRAGCQIDYMVQTKFHSLYICQIKFSKEPIGCRVVTELKEKIACLQHPKSYSYRPVLIHVNGVTDDLVEENYFTDIVDFGQLLS